MSGTVRAYGLETSAQHLSCFVGGMLALGGCLAGNESHVDLGGKLTRSCIWLYQSGPGSLLPEACTLADRPDPGSSFNSMESFWLGETHKYFYLVFPEPELVSLGEWVFNTEAHPFGRMVA